MHAADTYSNTRLWISFKCVTSNEAATFKHDFSCIEMGLSAVSPEN